MKPTVKDQLIYTTINLALLKSGRAVGTGTGFFWRTRMGDSEVVSIVTNKHVVADSDELVAICHHRLDDGSDAPSEENAQCTLMTGGASLWAHPDPDVDLCALPFGPILNQAVDNGKPLFIIAIDMEQVPKPEEWAGLDSIEDILMVGCPRGIYDPFNNIPVTRRGITATPVNKRYGGRNEFMVDIACFPGSSGSPVFLEPKPGFIDRETGSYNMSSRFYFLGVLYAGPLISQSGEIVLSQQPRVEVASMMHLGQVIRADEMAVLDDVIRASVRSMPAT